MRLAPSTPTVRGSPAHPPRWHAVVHYPALHAHTTERAASASASLSHRADIQGLRAVAVLLVVLGHAGVGFVSGGYVGVDVFFVLSGFLITGLLLAEARKHGSVSLLDFYVRRARRILPAAALTLLVTDAATYFVLNFVRGRQAVEDSLHAAGFAANFQFAARGVDYFAKGSPPSPVLHYWSLSVEEQFYLVWPLLLSIALFGFAVMRRRRPATAHEGRLLGLVAVLSTASLAWSIHLTSASPTTAYFSPFTRAWELGLGATLAVGASTLARLPAAARVTLGWAGLATIAIAAIGFSDSTPFPGSAALVPTLGTAAAIVAGMGRMPRGAAARALSIRPMVVVGDRSYALYLWHWPVLILAADYAGHDLPVTVKLGLVAAAFVLSCVTYALVEDPIRRRVRRRATTGIVALGCMVAVLATAMVALAGIDRERQQFEGPTSNAPPTAPLGIHGPTTTARGALPSVIAAVQAARRAAPLPSGLMPPIDRLSALGPAYSPPPGCIGHDASRSVPTKVCRVGDPTSRKLVVLLGDSHAMMWLPAVLEMAWHDHLAVVPLLRLGCSPGKWFTNRGPDGDVCRAWLRWSFDQVRRLRPAVTLVGGNIDGRHRAAAQPAIDGVVRAAQILRRAGPVVVIGDPEGLSFEPVDRLLSNGANMATCTTTWAAGVLAAYDEENSEAKRAGAGFLGTRGFVCYERHCPAVIGSTIAWLDDNHLSGLYSAEVAGAFRAAFLRSTGGLRRR
ncbi:MAG TPA: acyltransferase family protein [Gaiellaceae bacterium]|nr:acyltransferase family protein [Gaiellaceae bacterium]